MKKILCFILLFVGILCITNNVFATTVDYASVQCGKEIVAGTYETRWTPYNNCRSSSDDSVITANAIILDYGEDGNIKIVGGKKYDDYNLTSDTPNIYQYSFAESTGHGSVKYTYVFDLTALSKYYKQSNIIPQGIVVSEVVGTASSNTVYYYFGASELETVSAGSRSDSYYAVNPNDDLQSLKECPDLDLYKSKLEADIAKYGATDEDVKDDSEKLGAICNDYVKYNHETSNSCYKKCITLKSDIAKMGVDIFNETNSCGFGEKMVAWLLRILKLLRFIVPILVIVLSTYEYINAILSADDDAFKKSGGRFGKRLFIMILFFVLPALLQFIFNIFNVDGLNSSNPYCLK